MTIIYLLTLLAFLILGWFFHYDSGANASMALMSEEKTMDLSPANARYFGLHNFGNTCYCNSVLQALFFCAPFREQVLQYRTKHGGRHSAGKKDSLLACLSDLFHSIVSQKKKMGVMQPKKFVARLRKENESFDNYMQHDAHEFFNHLLNSIHIYLLEEKKADLEKKRLLDQQSTSGIGIKKDRPSIFGRSRKGKKLHHSLNAMHENSLDASFALTENSAPQSDSVCSIEPRALTDDAAVLSSRANHQGDKSSMMNGKPFGGSSSNINHVGPTKSSSLSILNRIRSKKVSNSKLSEENNTSTPNTPNKQMNDSDEEDRTWIYDIFQGTYTTITRCLNCETVKNKDEDFLDLSVDIEQNTSITHCLRVFSHQQTLGGEHKYFCEVCRSKQEAEIEMRIKKLPTILVLHLKRFKYCDTLNKYTKLSYRVVFPFELRLFNTTEDDGDLHRLYDLIGVVVHCGSGPYRGHYISVVKSHGMWMVFDDDTVERMQPNNMEDFYGVTTDKNSESGYILFYQTRE